MMSTDQKRTLEAISQRRFRSLEIKMAFISGKAPLLDPTNFRIDMQSGTGTIGKRIFTITVGDGISAIDLIKIGKYDWVYDEARKFIESSRFRMANTLEEIEIVYVTKNDGDFWPRGVEMATEEDLLRFGAKYPEEQLKHPIFSLHKPFPLPCYMGDQLWSSHLLRLCQWNGDGRRILDITNGCGRWGDGCTFLARRSQRGLR